MSLVRSQITDGVATVTLHDPDRRNALTLPMVQEVEDLFDQLEADPAVGAVVVVLVLTADLRGAIGFSSFGVLVYYLVANLSALRQTAEHRLYPRALQVVGVTGCVVLVATLPVAAVVAGVGVLAVGVALRWARVRAERRPPRSA